MWHLPPSHQERLTLLSTCGRCCYSIKPSWCTTAGSGTGPVMGDGAISGAGAVGAAGAANASGDAGAGGAAAFDCKLLSSTASAVMAGEVTLACAEAVGREDGDATGSVPVLGRTAGGVGKRWMELEESGRRPREEAKAGRAGIELLLSLVRRCSESPRPFESDPRISPFACPASTRSFKLCSIRIVAPSM
mmetsp:Transcript_52678/g.115410  ORF Transcript_52678/g.115410 Transcript_52678/m.115410 type:complete len:191 (+) Transcript_52678:42-614(+)